MTKSQSLQWQTSCPDTSARFTGQDRGRPPHPPPPGRRVLTACGSIRLDKLSASED